MSCIMDCPYQRDLKIEELERKIAELERRIQNLEWYRYYCPERTWPSYPDWYNQSPINISQIS